MALAATAFTTPTATAERALEQESRGLSRLLGPSSALMAALAATPANGQSAEAEAADIFFKAPKSAVTHVDASPLPSIAPTLIAGFDETSPGIKGQGCITHTLADEPKGAYIVFDVRWGPQVEVIPTHLNEIGIMPDLPGANCASLEEFKVGAEARAHDFGQKFAAFIDGINPDSADEALTQVAAYLRDPESVKAPIEFARRAEQTFQILRGPHPSILATDLPKLGIAQHKEAFMIRVVEDSMEKIEVDLRNPQTEMRGIPINATPAPGEGFDGWATQPAVFTTGGDQPMIIEVQQTTEAGPTPGERGAVCVTYESADTGLQRLIVGSASGHAIANEMHITGPLANTTFNGMPCTSLEQLTHDGLQRGQAFIRDLTQFAADLSVGLDHPDLMDGLMALRDPAVQGDLSAISRETGSVFQALTEAAADTDPAVLQSIIAPERTAGLMAQGLFLEREATIVKRVTGAMQDLERQYGARVPVAVEPIRFESGPESPQAVQIREASVKDVAPEAAPGHEHRRRFVA